MTFKTLKPLKISLHGYSSKYVVTRLFDVETKRAAFLKIQVLKLHVWPSLPMPVLQIYISAVLPQSQNSIFMQ